MQLDIKLLGETEVKLDNKKIDFPYKKVEALFYYLIVEKKISRAKVASLLWGNMTDSKAKKNLRNALYQLKKSLKDDIFKKSGSSTLRLNKENYNFKIDLEQFMESDLLKKSLEVYNGDFLAGFLLKRSPSFNDWIIENRNYFQQLYIDKLKKKIDSLEKNEVNDKAINYLQDLINVDEFNEMAYRKLMKLYHKKGQSAKAIQIYKTLDEILEEELGINPDKKTLKLLQEIRSEKSIVLDNKQSVDFIFRENEIKELVLNTRSFISGTESHSYLISGEAGIGKTTLIKEFLEKTDLEDTIVLKTNCFQGEERYIFNPLKNIIKQLQEKLELDDLEISYPWKSIISILFPSLFANTEIENNDHIDFDSLQYQSALKALLYLLSSAAQKQKLILIFEDLQWSDEKSLSFITQLIKENKNRNIMVLGTTRLNMRNDILNEFSALKNHNYLKEIKLPRLNYDQVKTFVDKTLPDYNFNEKIYQNIYEETEGNTFFLVELLRLFKEKNRKKALSEFIQTEGCQNILQNKISNISEKANKLLMLAAVCYKEINFGLLANISGMDDFELIEFLEELQSHYLLEEKNDEELTYWFTHSKLKEYVYNQLSNSRLKLLHRRIANYLENEVEFSNNSRDRYSKLIYHYSKAGNKLKELEYLIKEAETYFKQTHKLFPVLHDNYLDNEQIVFLKKKEAKNYLDEIKIVIENININEDNREKLEELKVKFLNINSRYYLCQGEYDKAINQIEEMLKRAETINDYDILLEGYQELAGFGIQKENPELIENNARKILKLATEMNKDELSGVAHRYLGVSELYKKNYFDAKLNFEKALNIFNKAEELGEKFSLNIAGIYNYLGEVERYRGNFDKALEYYQEGINYYQGHETSHGLGILYTNLGLVYFTKNEINKAGEKFDKSIAIFNKLNTIWGYISIAYAYNALIAFYEGEYNKSNNLITKAENILDKHQKPYWKGILLRVKAEINSKINKNSKTSKFYNSIDLKAQEEYLKKAYNIFNEIGTPYEINIVKKMF
ncbi:MAG: AAA family ATPase [Bacillota bacterium]